MRSNPAVAFLLASNWAFAGKPCARPTDVMRALLKWRRRDILAKHGFPGTKAAVNVLSRLTPSAITIESMLYLRASMKDPAVMRVLCHLPHINRPIIRIVTDPVLWNQVEPSFLYELAEPDFIGPDETEDNPKAPWSLIQLFFIRDTFMALRPQQGGVRFKSVRHLSRTYDELFAEDGRAREAAYRFVVLPPPPLEGNADIIPLSTSEMMLEEGREQHNCVGSYVPKVAGRDRYYAYRVLAPQRATLLIAFRKGRWIIEQLQSASNHDVPEDVRQAVQEWLDQKQAAGGAQPLAG